MLRALDDSATRACVEAERAFLRALGGGCRVPIAAYAQTDNGQLSLDGAVVAPDGSRILREHTSGSLDSPESVGEALANRLIAQGASELLRDLKPVT
jgi:hydroxymethylbilane synthase